MREAWYYIRVYMVQAAIALAAGGLALFKGHHWLAVGLIPLYLCGGLAAGGIAGALLPWCRNAFGAAVVGVIAILPFFLGVGLLLGPVVGWQRELWIAVVVCTVFYGVGGGVILYRARRFR